MSLEMPSKKKCEVEKKSIIISDAMKDVMSNYVDLFDKTEDDSIKSVVTAIQNEQDNTAKMFEQNSQMMMLIMNQQEQMTQLFQLYTNNLVPLALPTVTPSKNNPASKNKELTDDTK